MQVCLSCTSYYKIGPFVVPGEARDLCGINELCRVQERLMHTWDCLHWPLPEQETLPAP
jgi:hypothetical protein